MYYLVILTKPFFLHVFRAILIFVVLLNYMNVLIIYILGSCVYEEVYTLIFNFFHVFLKSYISSVTMR